MVVYNLIIKPLRQNGYTELVITPHLSPLSHLKQINTRYTSEIIEPSLRQQIQMFSDMT